MTVMQSDNRDTKKKAYRANKRNQPRISLSSVKQILRNMFDQMLKNTDIDFIVTLDAPLGWDAGSTFIDGAALF